jgi:hypothetical protein
MSIPRKKELEDAIKTSLQLFALEMHNSYHYSEETLRYLVVTQISSLKEYGTIPNRFKTKPQLSCQYTYKKSKSKASKEWKPDIISAIWNKDGVIVDPILAVEIKINSSDTDFEKCIHYVNDKIGQHSFQIAIMINIKAEWRFDLEYYKKKFKTRNEGKVYWCTLDETIDGKPKIVGKWF